MDELDAIRRKAWEQSVDRLNHPTREYAQRVAKNDLFIWLDAIQRAQARGAQELKLFYDPQWDEPLDRERAARLAPKLTHWALFCTREYHHEGWTTYYAAALQHLLQPPFRVCYGGVECKMPRTAGISPSWRYFLISWS